MDDLMFTGPTAEEEQASIDRMDSVITDAEQEYEQLGTLLTSTFILLTAHGIDAQEFINNLETNQNG